MTQIHSLVTHAIKAKPSQWYCNVVEGGNKLSAESFTVPGLDGYLLSVPYQDSSQGGDIHYITVCNHGVYSKFLILDVSGHGEKAGEISKHLYQPLFKLLDERDNTKILAKLNQIMIDLNLPGKFATVVLATYNRYFCSWTFSYAGHPSILLDRNNCWHPITTQGSAPIGIIGDTQFQQSTVFLEDGDKLLLFSDALTEIKLKNNSRLTEDGLINTLSQIKQDALNTYFQKLIEHLIRLNQGEAFCDDLTLILLEHKPKLHSKIITLLGKIFLSKKVTQKLCCQTK